MVDYFMVSLTSIELLSKAPMLESVLCERETRHLTSYCIDPDFGVKIGYVQNRSRAERQFPLPTANAVLRGPALVREFDQWCAT